MVQDMRDAIADHRRDRERFAGYLSAMDSCGLGASPFAETVRVWVKGMDGLTSGFQRPVPTLWTQKADFDTSSM